MTLVIAINLGSGHLLLSDARASDLAGNGSNDVVKTGVFFDGCLFGLAGNPAGGREFMRSFLEVLRAHPQPSIDACWPFFCQFVEGYEFDKSAPASFEIIFSERSSGKPEFHLLNSSLGLMRSITELNDGNAFGLSIGSGAQLFQNEVIRKIMPKIGQFPKMYLALGRTDEETAFALPYFICLLLNEMTFGPHRSTIEAHGVGGLFNFVVQDHRQEERQRTATYVITEINDHGKNRKIELQLHVNRVVPLTEGLAFQYYSSNRQFDQPGIHPCIDLLSDCPLNEFTDEMKRELEAECTQKLDDPGVCVFGYAKPEHQLGWQFEFGRLLDFLNEDGSPDEHLSNQVNGIVEESRRRREAVLRL